MVVHTCWPVKMGIKRYIIPPLNSEFMSKLFNQWFCAKKRDD